MAATRQTSHSLSDDDRCSSGRQAAQMPDTRRRPLALNRHAYNRVVSRNAGDSELARDSCSALICRKLRHRIHIDAMCPLDGVKMVALFRLGWRLPAIRKRRLG